MRSTLLILTTCIAVLLGSCSRDSGLPEDKDLEMFIRYSARCAYLERAYSDRELILRQEIEEIELPPDWEVTVDSLLIRYGAEPDFWQEVFAEISDRSRRSPAEEAGDIE
jgi:hypothetical protein